MYKVKKWTVFFVFMVVLLTALSFLAYRNEELKDTGESLFGGHKTLHLWYHDDALTDYLTNAAAAYYEETGVTVIPTLHNEAGYLDNIYNASVKEEETLPDLYLIGNDSLGRAYAAGMTRSISKDDEFFSGDSYPETALNAVSCRDNYQGYPLYFETTVLLYNKTFMEMAAVSEAERAEAEMVGEVTAVDDENADIAVEPLTYEDAVERGYTLETVFPKTVEGILEFAENYDAPVGVESVFKWDVTDIFYNYYFPGSYMDVGGDSGDDSQRLDINNEKVRSCMELYQTLNQFFSIDTNDVSYSKVLQEFIDGKVVMTVATSDAIARMERAVADGEFEYEYETAPIPDITGELDSRSLSVTTALVVNGFSDNGKAADDFARYLVSQRSGMLYGEGGKIPALKGIELPDKRLEAYKEEYKYSISMPKLLGASNFWVQLEICCARIWEGADVGELLEKLQASMEEQI